MVGEEIINGTSEVVSVISPYLADKLGSALTVLKAAGIIFILYVLFWIVNGILRWRDRKRLKIIERKVKSIDSKLDDLLDKKKTKKKKS